MSQASTILSIKPEPFNVIQQSRVFLFCDSRDTNSLATAPKAQVDTVIIVELLLLYFLGTTLYIPNPFLDHN